MATRSRYGCATCRRRKKKCDEQRPECGQCISRNTRCGGYDMQLTWTNAVASRGHLMGSKLGATDTATSQSAHIQGSPGNAGNASNGSSAYVVAHRIGSQDSSQSDVRARLPGHPSPNEPLLRNDDEKRNYVLSQFLEEGIHRLYASTASASIVEAFKDLVPTSEVLKLVCIALQEVISNGSTLSALEQTGTALELFRHQISSDFLRNQEELFMAGSWICTLHLIQGLPWTSTFYQFLDFCHIDNDLSQLRPNPRYHLGVRQQIETISVLDFPNFVLGRVSPSRGLWKRFRQLQNNWDDRYNGGIEPVTGLPRTLLDHLAPELEETEADTQQREQFLWHWIGQTSSSLWKGQLWDCYRYAGILAIRHQRSLLHRKALASNGLQPSPNTDIAEGPPTDIVLFRLLCSLNAVLNEGYYSGSHASLQVQHLALYPLVYGSLQISALKATEHPWREDLKRMRSQVIALEPVAQKHTLLLFKILDEAWEAGFDGFDADEAARRHEAEITII